MNVTTLAATLLLAFAVPASAAGLAVYPRDPTNQDALLLVVHSAPPCATIAFDAVELLEGGVIRVPFDDGSRVLCSNPNPCPLRVPLGRLPAGRYAVEFVPDRLSLVSASATQFTVFAALAPGEAGYDWPRRGWGPRGC